MQVTVRAHSFMYHIHYSHVSALTRAPRVMLWSHMYHHSRCCLSSAWGKLSSPLKVTLCGATAHQRQPCLVHSFDPKNLRKEGK